MQQALGVIPRGQHGLWVDGEGNVWLGGNAVALDGKRPADRQVLKLSNDGKLLLQIGHPTMNPQNNQDTSFLGGPGEMTVDDAAHEVYIADGYMNKRVVVYDSNTGAFKRGWGAYGIPLSQIDNGKPAPHDPATPAKQFSGPVACVKISLDGFVSLFPRTGFFHSPAAAAFLFFPDRTWGCVIPRCRKSVLAAR